MKRHTALRTVLLVVIAAAIVGCSSSDSKHNSSASQFLARGTPEADGFVLAANPSATVTIDLTDANTPIDSTNNKHYAEVTLLATAHDDADVPQVDLPVTFTAGSGVLASAGVPVNTDANGVASDTLRVFEDAPATFTVTASDGTRTETITITVVLVTPNEPPVANAGMDVTSECMAERHSTVVLDGSGSTDPDSTAGTHDDIVSFEWFEHFGEASQTLLGTGETLQVSLELGTHVITLRVTDSAGVTATDTITVNVVDTTPPEVSSSVQPSLLWPPNHRMVDVHSSVVVDDCTLTTVTLTSVTSNEPENGMGDGDTAPDILGAEIGSADAGFQVRAERSGGGSGRVYTVVVTAVDEAGNSASGTSEVVVPHDRGHR